MSRPEARARADDGSEPMGEKTQESAGLKPAPSDVEPSLGEAEPVEAERDDGSADAVLWLARISAASLGAWCGLFALDFLLALFDTDGFFWAALAGMVVRLASLFALVVTVVAGTFALVLVLARALVMPTPPRHA